MNANVFQLLLYIYEYMYFPQAWHKTDRRYHNGRKTYMQNYLLTVEITEQNAYNRDNRLYNRQKIQHAITVHCKNVS